MAESIIWIVIASLLASFDTIKYVDRDFVVTSPSGEYSSGTLCYPLLFKCTFRPQSSHVESLARGET
ncbi:cytochrome p450 [Moniliophthora roreri]|nr:cytochrome p450 [Moniliophthora roreri]